MSVVPDENEENYPPCPKCDGKGRTDDGTRLCPDCNGSGREEKA